MDHSVIACSNLTSVLVGALDLLNLGVSIGSGKPNKLIELIRSVRFEKGVRLGSVPQFVEISKLNQTLPVNCVLGCICRGIRFGFKPDL